MLETYFRAVVEAGCAGAVAWASCTAPSAMIAAIVRVAA